MLESQQSFLSVGIDVGTTSTHLVVSKLKFANVCAANQAPRFAITEREIVHRSKIYMTPLEADGSIAARQVAEILAHEYEQAGLQAASVATGAVIVTGESARLRNAQAVVRELSSLAGDFVAASAGPHLESILAARGSGAASASLERQVTICNVDIGGGTANACVYSCGELLDTACLGLGGRFMQLDQAGTVTAISDNGELFLDALAKRIGVGDQPDQEMLELLGNLAAETLVFFFYRKRPAQISERLLVTDSLKKKNYTVDEYWFSGGVAEFMQRPPQDPLLFGDIGAYVASGLVAALTEYDIKYRVCPDPVRATVIGAGNFSVQLSGATVAVDSQNLPLKNVPVLRPFACDWLDCEGLAKDDVSAPVAWIQKQIEAALARHELNWRTAPLAIALPPLRDLGFAHLSVWAQGLADSFNAHSGRDPLVVVLTQDVGMALGQLLRQHLAGHQLAVIDSVQTTSGDFIDIGAALPGHTALPVIIKDLVFNA